MLKESKKVIDFRDSLTTISLLKLSQVFGEMNLNEILEIRGADPNTRQDLFKVLPESSYEIVHSEDGENGASMYRVYIRKCR